MKQFYLKKNEKRRDLTGLRFRKRTSIASSLSFSRI